MQDDQAFQLEAENLPTFVGRKSKSLQRIAGINNI